MSTIVTYIGEEPQTEAFGYTFPRGEPVEVEGLAAQKLSNNPQFEAADEAPKRRARAATDDSGK